MKVGLFIPCYINAVYPQVGVASFKLLKSLGDNRWRMQDLKKSQ